MESDRESIRDDLNHPKAKAAFERMLDYVRLVERSVKSESMAFMLMECRALRAKNTDLNDTVRRLEVKVTSLETQLRGYTRSRSSGMLEKSSNDKTNMDDA